MTDYIRIAKAWVNAEVIPELRKATEKFGKFNSMHEGYAIILEELDELWTCIKTKGKDSDD